MPDFAGQDLTGARFEDVRLRDAVFRSVDLGGARIVDARLDGVRMSSVEVPDLEIEGEIGRLVVNGVDVAPYVEAELDRRDPDRPLMRPTTADGFRTAWEVVELRWAETVERARGLDPELLHASVDG